MGRGEGRDRDMNEEIMRENLAEAQKEQGITKCGEDCKCEKVESNLDDAIVRSGNTDRAQDLENEAAEKRMEDLKEEGYPQDEKTEEEKQFQEDAINQGR